ncbi:unnamed protein product [Paramecium sonneborni]|uniref:Uncharacterized protein n=1 Tax=Paramecium sonneborni TaxID=65129 RepID=A0A8S1PMH7_9CILI|nr:unnamed protein product [Paramecium sonneborni]
MLSVLELEMKYQKSQIVYQMRYFINLSGILYQMNSKMEMQAIFGKDETTFYFHLINLFNNVEIQQQDQTKLKNLFEKSSLTHQILIFSSKLIQIDD